MPHWIAELYKVLTWHGQQMICTKQKGKLTANNDTCNLLANSPYAVWDIQPQLFNSAHKIIAHNPAMVAHLQCMFERLPY